MGDYEGFEGGDQEESTKKDFSSEYLSRKGEGQMEPGEFEAIVGDALMQSVQFVDTELSPERALATEYYLGKPFGNEEDGRSQVVLTEVRDAVNGIVPALMRIFFGADNVVEFVPSRANAVAQAQQATDYVRYVFNEDNPGFLNTLGVLKDGLIRKIGIFKWGWDPTPEIRSYKLQNITQDELELLAADDDVELASTVPVPTRKQDALAYQKAQAAYEQAVQAAKQQQATAAPQQTAQRLVAGATGAAAAQPGQAAPPIPPAPQPSMPTPPPAPPQLYDVEVRRTLTGGRARVWMLPPEEFIFNREARDLDNALIVAHRTDKTRGQLLALGIPEEEIDEHAGSDGSTDVSLKGNAEELARRDVAGVGRVFGFGYTVDPEMGEANDKILYTEAYMTIDFDGDGVAELRRICTIGPQYHPVSNDPASERPFSIFVPDPEPHTLLGGSWADRTMDLQRIKSFLLRGTLDSLSASIFPRTIYTEGQASVADILNTAIGAPIRERTPNSVRSFAHEFTGQAVFPFFALIDDIVERRTGQEKGAQGLDANALQSMDKEGVQAAISASQLQTELVARVFAESAFKPLFRGLNRLLIEHQPRPRVVRLRGQYVEVDPRSWDANMDVTVNIGLGTTFIDKKIQTLIATATEQKDALTNLGPTNPLTTFSQLYNTYAQILRYQGYPDASPFFNQPPPNWSPPPAPPPQDPNQVLAEAQVNVEKLKSARDLAIKKDELNLQAQKQAFDHAIALKKLDNALIIAKYTADAQNGTTLSIAQLDNELSTEAKETELTMQAHGMLHDQMMDRAAHSLAAEQAAQPDPDAAPDPTDDGGAQ